MTSALPALPADPKSAPADAPPAPKPAREPARSAVDFLTLMGKAISAQKPAEPAPAPVVTAKGAANNLLDDVLSKSPRQARDQKAAAKPGGKAGTPGAAVDTAVSDAGAALMALERPPELPAVPVTRPQVARATAEDSPANAAPAERGVPAPKAGPLSKLPPPAALAASDKPAAQPSAAPDKPAPKPAVELDKAAQAPPIPRLEPALKAPPRQTGMAVALTEGRMKFATEQNEIAGSAAQKLPPVQPISPIAPKSGASDSRRKLSVDFSPGDNAIESLTFTSLNGKGGATASASEAAVAAHPAFSAERFEQLLTREVVSFKQTGVGEVGVSLKIDPQTQLFLQLTSRDGQTQAMLRCEKGDLPGLGSHWAQLQESLARQNVQLLPMSPSHDLSRQDARERQPQPRPQAEDQTNPAPSQPRAARAAKTRNQSRQGWETWA